MRAAGKKISKLQGIGVEANDIEILAVVVLNI
jgi:hypothetical protein